MDEFVCLFVRLFVEAITLEPFEIIVMKFSREQDLVRRSDEFENGWILVHYGARVMINPLKGRGNYIATSNNMKLVPLMGGMLHLVQRGGDWAGPHPAQAPPRCTKCNSPPINSQCTNFILFDVAI